MYNHLPLYRDKALLCALAALGFFTLVAVAIGAAGYHFSGGVHFIPLMVGFGMAPVLREYSTEVRDTYRRNRRRNVAAREARARRDARLAAA